MFQRSLFALLATPFNYIGLFFTVIIVLAIAFYVYAMVQRVVALPDRARRARLTGSLNGSGRSGVAEEDIAQASMSLDEEKLVERPVHTEEAHETSKDGSKP